MKLTARQQEILDFIRDYRDKHGYSPSVREIGKELGIKSPNGVRGQLDALVKKGALTRTPYKSRSLLPVEYAERTAALAYLASLPTDRLVGIVEYERGSDNTRRT